MRLAVLADVHGNLPALEAVLADVDQHGVDGIVVAGDLTACAHAIETIRLLRERGSWIIQGNSEVGLLAYAAGSAPQAWYENKQFALARWDYHHLDRETLGFIASLPEQRVVALNDTTPIRVVHGSPRNSSEGLFPDRDPDTLRMCREAHLLKSDPAPLHETLAQVGEAVLVCGHTHIPWKQAEGEKLALNPGAVCGPLNGDARAQYAILTWGGGRWQVEHRRVTYDLARIRADFEQSGLLEEGGVLARAFLLSNETGKNVAVFFLEHAYRLAAEAGFENREFVPDDIWEQATNTFDWDGATRGAPVSNP